MSVRGFEFVWERWRIVIGLRNCGKGGEARAAGRSVSRACLGWNRKQRSMIARMTVEALKVISLKVV